MGLTAHESSGFQIQTTPWLEQEQGRPANGLAAAFQAGHIRPTTQHVW